LFGLENQQDGEMKKFPYDELQYLHQELSSLEKQLEIWGIDMTTFISDDKKWNVFLRTLNAIGEIMRELPAEIIEHFPEIPWQVINENLENQVSQDLVVEIEKIWDVLVDSIPSLLEAINEILVSGEIE
jgi:uncharacterized protein with HEPN domain